MLSLVRFGNKYIPKNYGFIQRFSPARYESTKTVSDTNIQEEKPSSKQNFLYNLKLP